MSSFGRDIHQCPTSAPVSLVVHPHSRRPGSCPARKRLVSGSYDYVVFFLFGFDLLFGSTPWQHLSGQARMLVQELECPLTTLRLRRSLHAIVESPNYRRSLESLPAALLWLSADRQEFAAAKEG